MLPVALQPPLPPEPPPQANDALQAPPSPTSCSSTPAVGGGQSASAHVTAPNPSLVYTAWPSNAVAIPDVSQMLMREAEAWRALLSLHQGVVGTARVLATMVSPEPGPTLETSRESLEQREAQYHSALSNLVSQCDALTTECLRLRSLRKARRATDVQALQILMQSHTIETLALGASRGTSSSINVQAATAEIRLAAQTTRQEITQLRALMQVAQEAPRLHAQIRLTVGVDAHVRDISIANFFAELYRHSSHLTDSAVEETIERVCTDVADYVTPTDRPDPPVESVAEDAVAVAPPRLHVRRSTDSSCHLGTGR